MLAGGHAWQPKTSSQNVEYCFLVCLLFTVDLLLNTAHQKLSLEQLEKALMALPADFREVVILRDLQQMTYEEISEKTGIAMGTVKSRINRGRAQIKHLIENYVELGTSF